MDLPFAEVMEALEVGDWDKLLAHDQLVKERANNRVFYGFSEAPPLFPPTYRFALGFQGRSSVIVPL